MIKAIFYSLILFLSLALVLQSCKTSSKVPSKNEIVGDGTASWYGPGFHGNLTASGEKYDKNELTAAHPTLPFNSIVRVVNLENGKTVDVRINDRGPNIKNRIIDLSEAAAQQVDMIDDGLAQVRIILLQSTAAIPSGQPGEKFYTVQIASLTNKREAESISTRYKDGWVQSAMVDGIEHYRVYVGKFGLKDAAEEARLKLRRRGINGFVKQVQN